MDKYTGFSYFIIGFILFWFSQLLAPIVDYIQLEVENKRLFKKILKNFEKELNKNA